MVNTFKIACVQTNSVREVAPNIEAVDQLVRQASADGANFVLLPETVNMLEPRGRYVREKMMLEDADPTLKAFQTLAGETGVWLLIGSLILKYNDEQAVNRSFLLNDQGEIVARYDKIHMFDVDVGDGQRYQESRLYRPGEEAVVADTPWGKIGLTVCYDLRFPYLYRALAQSGASFITVPSAFTRVTGQSHWHVLLRARAIETGCFVFAPAQCGDHAEGRQTFGHSLIVDPWGEVLADGGEEVGIVTAEIDPALVEKAHQKIPSLSNDREFA